MIGHPFLAYILYVQPSVCICVIFLVTTKITGKLSWSMCSLYSALIVKVCLSTTDYVCEQPGSSNLPKQ